MTKKEEKLLNDFVNDCIYTVETNLEAILNNRITTYMDRFITLNTPEKYIKLLKSTNDDFIKKANIRLRRRLNKKPEMDGLDVFTGTFADGSIGTAVFIGEFLKEEEK